MAKSKEGQAQEQKQAHKKKQVQVPNLEYTNYLIFLHKRKVEVHIDYGGTILKLQGILRAKAQYDIQLILDEEKKEIVTVNKAYIVMVKPL